MSGVYEVYLISSKYKDCNIDFYMMASWRHVASRSSVTPLYGRQCFTAPVKVQQTFM